VLERHEANLGDPLYQIVKPPCVRCVQLFSFSFSVLVFWPGMSQVAGFGNSALPSSVWGLLWSSYICFSFCSDG
jgi:hypothetical protein